MIRIKIFIDTELILGNLFGAGIYTKNIVQKLMKTYPDNEYLFLRKRFLKNPFFDSLIRNLIWKQLVFPIFAWVRRIDVALFPNPPISFLARTPQVVIVPDLSFFFEKSSSPIVRWSTYIFYYLSCKIASKVITISFNSKKDIIRLLFVPRHKVEVAYLAVDIKIFKPMDKEVASKKLEKYHISGKFIIGAPGSLIPRKNTNALIHAYNKLPDKLKSRYNLVIIAKKHGTRFDTLRYYETLRLINELNLSSKVIITDYVQHEDLVFFYNASELLIYPSLYEGFGLPPLEALACGTPVIASNTSSIPEVIGNAGILVDPTSINLLAKCVEEILTDEIPKRNLREIGLKKAQLFSWEKAANTVMKVLEQVAMGT